MDGGDVATETGLTAELRRARMGCGGLPSAVSGTGGGSALLGWWWSYGSGAGVARRELCAAMATAELRELGGCCCEEERPRRSKWGRGTARADAGVMKARSGASWPARSGRWRRAAVAADTRRSCSGAGRPPIGFDSVRQSRHAEPDDEF